MKLLFCPECGDIFSLSRAAKQCTCGATSGHYLTDGLHAVYSGAGVPLGIANNSFDVAMDIQNRLNARDEIPFEGVNFTAFCIPANCKAFVKRP